MKLLYITNQISAAAGLERVLSIKASALADDFNYDVHILTLNQGDQPLFYSFSNKIIYHDISIKGKKMNYLFHYITKIRAIVKRIKPDCISVCDDGLKGFYLPFILKGVCPIIYERHASKYISLNSNNFTQRIKLFFQNKLMHFGAKKFDAFVVLTENNAKEWGLKNIKVIPNPLSFNPKEFSNVSNKKIITVGSHYHQKGFDILLDVWSKVSPLFPEWQLDIYGKIDEDETYVKLAKQLKINDKVNFHNPVKNIGSKYKEASIYAMTSRSEGFGMVLIEAMAYGVPCIAFDCPSGPKDIITHNEDGYLIANGDQNAYSEKLKYLMANIDTRQNMGKAAIIKSKTYLPEFIILQWHRLFTNLRPELLK